jgi:anti-sigma regulatory factor (Ser/Thr protein kinase)
MPAMATVELSFTPLPAHVRTARLVATAVARRSGVEESLLDEVRLAVGEACSRAVEAHRLRCPGEPVRIQLSDTGGRFEVVVADAVPGPVADAAAMRAAARDSAARPTANAAAVARIASAVPQQDAAGQRPAATAVAGDASGAANGGLPADIGLAVIAGLADDVQISATDGGVSIRMSWPTA